MQFTAKIAIVLLTVIVILILLLVLEHSSDNNRQEAFQEAEAYAKNLASNIANTPHNDYTPGVTYQTLFDAHDPWGNIWSATILRIEDRVEVIVQGNGPDEKYDNYDDVWGRSSVPIPLYPRTSTQPRRKGEKTDVKPSK
jgi:hypothetical protein